MSSGRQSSFGEKMKATKNALVDFERQIVGEDEDDFLFYGEELEKVAKTIVNRLERIDIKHDLNRRDATREVWDG